MSKLPVSILYHVFNVESEFCLQIILYFEKWHRIVNFMEYMEKESNNNVVVLYDINSKTIDEDPDFYEDSVVSEDDFENKFLLICSYLDYIDSIFDKNKTLEYDDIKYVIEYVKQYDSVFNVFNFGTLQVNIVNRKVCDELFVNRYKEELNKIIPK